MTPDSWTHLKKFSAARIALGRAGGSLPTRERLEFQLAHARARDAVWAPFDAAEMAARLAVLAGPPLILASAATDRATYLRRPELGRRLAAASRVVLMELAASRPPGGWDLVVVISDGLSARAVAQAVPLLESLWPRLAAAGWRLSPLLIVPNARVVLPDEAGGLLGAQLSLILLGERPGLGSPDSLGAYLTFRPAPGKTDAERNCVSNIRPEGLPPGAAAEKLFYLISESRRRQLSGVGLKDGAGERQLI